jgi:hypothetical protein
MDQRPEVPAHASLLSLPDEVLDAVLGCLSDGAAGSTYSCLKALLGASQATRALALRVQHLLLSPSSDAAAQAHSGTLWLQRLLKQGKVQQALTLDISRCSSGSAVLERLFIEALSATEQHAGGAMKWMHVKDLSIQVSPCCIACSAGLHA